MANIPFPAVQSIEGDLGAPGDRSIDLFTLGIQGPVLNAENFSVGTVQLADVLDIGSGEVELVWSLNLDQWFPFKRQRVIFTGTDLISQPTDVRGIEFIAFQVNVISDAPPGTRANVAAFGETWDSAPVNPSGTDGDPLTVVIGDEPVDVTLDEPIDVAIVGQPIDVDVPSVIIPGTVTPIDLENVGITGPIVDVSKFTSISVSLATSGGAARTTSNPPVGGFTQGILPGLLESFLVTGTPGAATVMAFVDPLPTVAVFPAATADNQKGPP